MARRPKSRTSEASDAESNKTAAEAPPRPPATRTQEEKDADWRSTGGPTLFVNRILVQTYGDGTVRIVFSEQFSAHGDIPPAFRQAVFMHPQTASELVRQLVNALPPEHIPIFNWEEERKG
jgi:hypothetical protein